jgi:hypothetical protein
MKLVNWRGERVVLTDPMGGPVLKVDRWGTLVEDARPRTFDDDEAPSPDLGALARNVATWIEWTSDEPGEFSLDDIHPQIRDLVAALAPQHVAL